MPLISFDDARAQLLGTASPLTETATLALADTYGKVLGADICAPFDVPPFDNSAMDGYAVRATDVTLPGIRMPVSQRIAAGESPATLAPGSAARIFTGAPMPNGADTVLMQEMCTADNGFVIVNEQPTAGQHVRKRGHEIKTGRVVLAAGTRLSAAHLGLAASLGLAALPILHPLRVAIFFTGTELVAPGTPLAAGQIYNSNRFVMRGMLQSIGAEIIDLGIIPDNFDATCAALSAAAQQADVILTSGGMSVGEEDHVKAAVEKVGQLTTWKIAVKPGKPLAFGQVGNTPFIGLPGNPVSVWVAFSTIVLSYLQKRQGVADYDVKRRHLPAGFGKRTGDRREFLRVQIDDAGQLVLHTNQDSGALSSAAWASGLADLPANSEIAAGQMIDYWPAPGFGQS